MVRQIELGLAETRRTYTRAFERYANHLCQRMTIQDAVRQLGAGWDVIKDIQKRYLDSIRDPPCCGSGILPRSRRGAPPTGYNGWFPDEN